MCFQRNGVNDAKRRRVVSAAQSSQANSQVEGFSTRLVSSHPAATISFDAQHRSTSSARCGPSKQLLDAYPGEKVTLALAPPTSVLLHQLPGPLWFEHMQDMTGYVQQETTSLPLDEQFDCTNSTAHTEYDFIVQNPGPPSPELLLGDTSEGVISEDSDMFDYTNYETLDSKPEYKPEPPLQRNLYDNMHSGQSKTSLNMGTDEGSVLSQKLPICRPVAVVAATVKIEKSKYHLSDIIDSEEPLIKEDPDLLYGTQNKMDVDIKAEEYILSPVLDSYMDKMNFADMYVANEEIVITEEEDEREEDMMRLMSIETEDVLYPLSDCLPSDCEEEMNSLEDKSIKDDIVPFELEPFNFLTCVDGLFNGTNETSDLDKLTEDDYFNSSSITPEEIEQDHLARNSITQEETEGLLVRNRISSLVEDLLVSLTDEQPQSTDLQNHSSHQAVAYEAGRKSINNQMFPNPEKKPSLTLDIGTARAPFLAEHDISNTPEILETLKPKAGFSLLDFIDPTRDPNNNSPVEPWPKKPEAPRKGKSHLSILQLKEAQKQGRGKLLPKSEDGRKTNEPLPSTSGTTSVGRPARQSATRFKKMIKEGLLNSVVDSRSVSSDDEDEDAPKAKRRRTTSTNRRRLNSDSDQSSISEDAMKYRERRDRNNLSSKRSRQKRKMHYQMKQKELKELENKNNLLRKKAELLQSMLTRVKAAWAQHLASIKDNDKDRGDGHC